MKLKLSVLLSILVFVLFFVSPSVVKAGTATLSWNANTEPDLASYKIYYGTSARTGTDPKSCGLCGYSSTQSVGNVLTHTFSSLTDGQKYYFSVSAIDTSNNESTFSTEVSKTIPAAVVPTPTIASFSASPTVITTGQSSTLSWNVTGATSLSINQGIGTVTGTSRSVSPTATTTYTLTATNGSGSATANATVTISGTPVTDTTPPIISSVVSSSIASGGASITWTTNEASDSQIEYGLTSAYGSFTSLNSYLATSHTEPLSGLLANTFYHYRVKSKDTYGNSAVSSDYSFTTLAVSIIPTPTPTPTPAPTPIPGCEGRTTGFSTITGQACSGSTTSRRIYNFSTVTLRLGFKGEAIKELQRYLNATLNLGLVVDGKFGPKTVAIVRKWQRDHGLVADGLVGKKTKAIMNAGN